MLKIAKSNWETHYAYGTISTLLETFTAAGLEVEDVSRWPLVRLEK